MNTMEVAVVGCMSNFTLVQCNDIHDSMNIIIPV